MPEKRMRRAVNRGKLKRPVKHKPSPSAIMAKKIFIFTIFLLAQVLFYHSDFFKLQEIKIQGNNKISNDVILQTAGIPSDQNIITLPLKKFQEKLGTIHWIKNVKLNWTLPGTIHITVEERSPVILCRRNGEPDNWFALDEEGMILYQPEEDLYPFPRLVIDHSLETGKMIRTSKIESVRIVNNHIPEDIRKHVEYYLVDDMDEVTVQLNKNNKPYKIKIGKAEELKRKIESLKAITRLIEEQNLSIKYLDVRYREATILPEDNEESDKKES
jgi:cell division septal protein FtsQ